MHSNRRQSTQLIADRLQRFSVHPLLRPLVDSDAPTQSPSLEESPLLWMMDDRVSKSTIDQIARWHTAVVENAFDLQDAVRLREIIDECFSQMGTPTVSNFQDFPEIETHVDDDSAETGTALAHAVSDAPEADSPEADAYEATPAHAATSNRNRLDRIYLTLAASHCFPAVATQLPREQTHTLIDQLWALASKAQATHATTNLLVKSLGIEAGIAISLVQGEPVMIAEQFLLEEFESIIEAELDGDGWPNGRSLPEFGLLAACWSRSYLMLKSVRVEFDFEIVLQIEWMARQALRMRRHDGGLTFVTSPTRNRRGRSTSATDPHAATCATATQPNELFDEPCEEVGCDDFWKALMFVSHDEEDQTLLVAATGDVKRCKKTSKRTLRRAKQVAEPYNISEWGSSAILRANWGPRSPRLGINFSNISSFPRETEHAAAATKRPGCLLELGRSQNLLFGDTTPRICIDDRQLHGIDGFEIICDRSDEDLDYLELHLELSSDYDERQASLNRQFLLSRTDEFLLVIDTVVPHRLGDHRQDAAGQPTTDTHKPAELSFDIQYQCDWPFAEGIEGLHEDETREVYLQQNGGSRKIQSLVLPLALPEWKSAPSGGRLEVTRSKLSYRHQAQGFGLCTPLVFDLKPKRSCKKRTWRQLTVAQDRRRVPFDHGCAFRFQLNNSQWVVYRAVATTGNRTFLGENTVAEFVVKKFKKDGNVSELLEVK